MYILCIDQNYYKGFNWGWVCKILPWSQGLFKVLFLLRLICESFAALLVTGVMVQYLGDCA